MPNPIKYSTGSESDALKKGNLFIGTGAVGKGPSDTTGYYQGPSVPTNGYVIYMNKVGAPGELSYHSAANDSELISFTNSLAGESFTTVTQCFNYYYSQTDKVLVNQDYPADFPYIVMDGLVLYLDAGITQSYPGSGSTWSDINGLGPKNNGTLINGPTFSSDGGGSFAFDRVNDYINCGKSSSLNMVTEMTLTYWLKFNGSTWSPFVGKAVGADTANYRTWMGSDRGFDVEISTPGGVRPLFIVTSAELPTNSWCCLGIRFKNDGTLSGFFNGVKKNTVVKNIGSTNNSDFIIGAYGGVYGGGSISCLQLYNRALTDSEIIQNYNTQKGRFGL
jgi:hypothetical protein